MRYTFLPSLKKAELTTRLLRPMAADTKLRHTSTEMAAFYAVKGSFKIDKEVVWVNHLVVHGQL